MNRWVMRWVRLSTWAVGGTGLVYFALKYLATPTDPFAVVNHPWQPLWQHLHVVVAPLLVFAGGLLWQEHILRRWELGLRGRVIGLTLVLLFVPMVLSGYLLQVSVDDAWRRAWIWLHGITAGAWLMFYAVHVIEAARARSRQRAALGSPL